MINIPEPIMREFCREKCLLAKSRMMGIKKETRGKRVRFLWMVDGEVIEALWRDTDKEALYDGGSQMALSNRSVSSGTISIASPW